VAIGRHLHRVARGVARHGARPVDEQPDQVEVDAAAPPLATQSPGGHAEQVDGHPQLLATALLRAGAGDPFERVGVEPADGVEREVVLEGEGRLEPDDRHAGPVS
jgi:hypothetical protein